MNKREVIIKTPKEIYCGTYTISGYTQKTEEELQKKFESLSEKN